MLALFVLFYLISLLLFVLSTIGVSVRQVNLLALGLFFWTLPPFLQAASKVF